MTQNAKRNTELRSLLSARRTQLEDQAAEQMRDWRTGRSTDGRDALDNADAESQGDLQFSLAQMRSQTLSRIDGALVRLEAGTYGICFECENEISEPRLRALPFAARCQECEGRREQTQRHGDQTLQRRGRTSLFSEATG
jgi:DnaK suppressor protein